MYTKKILVVGNEQETSTLFKNVLENQGYNVTMHDNGFAAMHTLKQHPIFAAFVDTNAPGMDGIETLKQIRSMSPWTNVVLITDYSQSEEANEALRLGCFVCMTKPFQIDDVLGVLNVLETGFNSTLRAA